MKRLPTIKSLINSAQWYQRTQKQLLKDYGRDADFMADLIAATSARTSIQINLQLAKEVYKRYCLFDNWENVRGLLPNHKRNIRRVLAGEPVSGIKVKAFAENLKGNLNSITIDGLIWDFYRPNIWITPNRHKKLSSSIRKIAKRFKLKPAEIQAILWVRIRGNKNAVLSMFDGVEL